MWQTGDLENTKTRRMHQDNERSAPVAQISLLCAVSDAVSETTALVSAFGTMESTPPGGAVLKRMFAALLEQEALPAVAASRRDRSC